LRSFGAWAASSSTVSVAYCQAVAVPAPNPAARLANVSLFAQVGQHQQGDKPAD